MKTGKVFYPDDWDYLPFSLLPSLEKAVREVYKRRFSTGAVSVAYYKQGTGSAFLKNPALAFTPTLSGASTAVFRCFPATTFSDGTKTNGPYLRLVTPVNLFVDDLIL